MFQDIFTYLVSFDGLKYLMGFVGFLTIVGTYAAGFNLIDEAISDESRAEFSLHVFGKGKVEKSAIERIIVHSLMSFFIQDNKLRKTRILMLSYAACVLALLLLSIFLKDDNVLSKVFYINFRNLVSFGEDFWRFIFFLAVIPPLTFLLDYYSFWVTKSVFIDKFPNNIFWGVLVDLTRSLLPFFAFMLLGLFIYWMGFHEHIFPVTITQIIFSAIIFQTVSIGSVVFISLSQFAIHSLARVIRSILKVLRLNNRIAVNSPLYSMPFKFIGMWLGAISFSVILFVGMAI